MIPLVPQPSSYESHPLGAPGSSPAPAAALERGAPRKTTQRRAVETLEQRCRPYLGLIMVLLWCAGCATPGPPLYPLAVHEEARSLYLVRHDWHTGVVVKASDIPLHLWPERADFPEALYLALGWGDRDFYQAVRAGVGILVQAALKSPASVLLVIGISTEVTRYFPHADILEIPLSTRALHELATFVHATYKRDATGQTRRLGPGHNHRHSMFYLAEGDYSLFNTCNSWTSKALQAAGLAVPTALQARGVFHAAQRYGQVIHTHPAP